MPNFQNFFKLDDAINSEVDTRTVFILSNEKKKINGHVGRYYTVFPTFKDFLKYRDNYPYCHEIFVDHANNKPNIAGRLVFDFDIKYDKCKKIPKNFKKQIEETIYDVIETYFNEVDPNKFIYVWSTSQNPKKLSKHLTVKNLYFDDWISMSKIFYTLFSDSWDKIFTWIKSNDLIDRQIVKNKGSLRMVGSSKIDGHPLIFDDSPQKLVDSFIRIYLKQQKRTEQLVTINNIIPSVFENVIGEHITTESSLSSDSSITISSTWKPLQGQNSTAPRKIVEPVYDLELYNKAFEIYNKLHPGIFKPGKISGKKISLLRLKAHDCLLSGNFHEQENAYINININDSGGWYDVWFGCYRKCYTTRHVLIGTVKYDDNDNNGGNKYEITIDIQIKNKLEKYNKSKKRNKTTHL